ncbi:type III-B CRISPR module-associated Cmr3 family protein [Streptomyces sp. P9(2023)]|uniref:type III-B CRISPR module-associated Cmr3 family protein n=1 Tax=Streptomyces sp. P9(2023) TaxID=3064394 RepID=UPI0028F40833|nr:type III-B CRISPR module-associated Cmr3 family protein [Streptomyces sp. P9(2023)]MDT9692646.1 type III-B CRISPR module-associated Cmr3 family protein [Streptomyces sp. P9(2023)]
MLNVHVTPVQPLALGRRPRGLAPVAGHHHVPGAVLRGALAAAWIAEFGPPQHAAPARRTSFNDLFEGRVRFGPLLARGSRVVPLSVHTCKYRTKADCSQQSYDETTDPGPRPQRCPVCSQSPLVVGRGQVELGPDSPMVIIETTRIELTTQETAATGQIFTRQELAPRSGSPGAHEVLRGQIATGAISDDQLAWLTTDRVLRLGGRRGTGGEVRYRAIPATSSPAPAGNPYTPDGELILRLLSPAVLVDAAGRPSNRPDLARLAQSLGIASVEIARAWTRWERVGGWNAVARLPKPEDLAVAAGSVYLLKPTGDPGPAGLTRLVEDGIGIRRAEGYGWLTLGPWQRPDRPAAASPGAATDRALTDDEALQQLAASGHGAWIARQIKRFANQKNLGPAAATTLVRGPEFARIGGARNVLRDVLAAKGNKAQLLVFSDRLNDTASRTSPGEAAEPNLGGAR